MAWPSAQRSAEDRILITASEAEDFALQQPAREGTLQTLLEAQNEAGGGVKTAERDPILVGEFTTHFGTHILVVGLGCALGVSGILTHGHLTKLEGGCSIVLCTVVLLATYWVTIRGALPLVCCSLARQS